MSEHQGVQRYPRSVASPDALPDRPLSRYSRALHEPGPCRQPAIPHSRASTRVAAAADSGGLGSTGDQSAKWLIRLCLTPAIAAGTGTDPHRQGPQPTDRRSRQRITSSKLLELALNPPGVLRLKRVDLNLTSTASSRRLPEPGHQCSGWVPPALESSLTAVPIPLFRGLEGAAPRSFIHADVQERFNQINPGRLRKLKAAQGGLG